MAEDKTRRTSKADKLLKQVTNPRFTFKGNDEDLELLRSIYDGTYRGTKPGDPSFHAYAAAINLANDFAGRALDILELIPFNNQVADIQEEYMPSYPPMSPVTSAFFGGWTVLDARDSFTGVTLGELFAQYLQHTGKLEYVQKAMVTLNGSYCAFYVVMEVGTNGISLWDIAGKREIQSWNGSGYPGKKGEVWYARLLPPFIEASNRSVTLSTPYVFIDSNRQTWEGFFQRHQASEFGADHSLRDYLKYGKWLGYWLEFVFQAYTNYTGNMIVARGVPDEPDSLPHSHPKRIL